MEIVHHQRKHNRDKYGIRTSAHWILFCSSLYASHRFSPNLRLLHELVAVVCSHIRRNGHQLCHVSHIKTTATAAQGAWQAVVHGNGTRIEETVHEHFENEEKSTFLPPIHHM